MKQIDELNYKNAVFKDLILKLNEISRAINKLIKKKPKIILKTIRKTKIIKQIIKSKPKIKFIKQIDKTKPRFHYPICPKCKSHNTKKGGVRRSLERGGIQRFYCNSCHYHFTPKGLEYRMRVNKFKLQKAFELFKQGLSHSQIANRIKGVSRQTIGKWLKKYKIPKKDRVFEREMMSRWGTPYHRKFNIKYKKNG